jgi:NADPH:quinone reductase-like Zn-dependent oxidoreductase
MKAVYMEQTGGPEVLVYGDRPDPVPGDDQVLVDIHAASVNAADWKARAGGYGSYSFPHVLGRDFSGVVTAVGKSVTGFRPGDEVFAVAEQKDDGGYAEKVAIKAAIVAHKPRSVSHVEAAALALTGLTAVSAVEETLKLKRGETILIQGGAGGVAGFAIQFAKHIGARVITTASAANHPYVLGLGADEAIDYNAVDFTEVVKGVDAAFDTVGGAVADRTLQVVRPGGRAAFISKPLPVPQRDDVPVLSPPVKRGTAQMARVAQLVDSGVVKAPEIKLYRLQDAVEAHRLSESRHFRGKLVFKVR